jgi:hypothetical protein
MNIGYDVTGVTVFIGGRGESLRVRMSGIAGFSPGRTLRRFL